jgi:hypothetical protein
VYDAAKLDADDTPFLDLAADANTQHFFFARPRIEGMVGKALRSIRPLQFPDLRYSKDSVRSVVATVVPRYEREYVGLCPLWDRLPRKFIETADTAIGCRVLIAMFKLYRTKREIHGALTGQQEYVLRRWCRRHYSEHENSWTEFERLLVTKGLHLCTLKLRDLFKGPPPVRSTDVVPVSDKGERRATRGLG